MIAASAVGTFLIPDEPGPFADYTRALCKREALHLLLARRLDAALLTDDRKLCRIAAEQGVQVLTP